MKVLYFGVGIAHHYPVYYLNRVLAGVPHQRPVGLESRKMSTCIFLVGGVPSKKNPISIDAIKACHLLQVLPVILRISLIQQNYIVYQISLAVIFTEITIDIFTRNIFGFFYKKIQILISKSLLGTYQLIGSPHVVQGSLFPSPRPTWFVAAWNFHTSWICLQPGFLLWVSLSTYSYSQKLDMIDMFVG